MARIGFIGLGNMGGPMCRRLIDAGHEVHAFDLDADRVSAAVGQGGRRAESAGECAAAAEFLLTSLPRPDHVRSVMDEAGALAALRPGSVWVDLTTNEVDLVADLADRAPPTTEAARTAFTRAAERYDNQAAELHVVRRIEDDADLTFRLPGAWTPPWEHSDPA